MTDERRIQLAEAWLHQLYRPCPSKPNTDGALLVIKAVARTNG